jgi:NTP pyrophosphatase (non-canonical NTP hydrolase)
MVSCKEFYKWFSKYGNFCEKSIVHAKQIEEYIDYCKDNAHSHGWVIVWDIDNVQTFPHQKILSIGDAIALCHSELSEALEAHRDNDIKQFSEEIADEFIRLFHLCGDLNIDIVSEINLKMEKNKNRPVNHGRVNY